MTYKQRGKVTETGLFGCPGKIARMSDETTKIKKKALGLGWAFIEYKDNTEDWLLLRPPFHRARRPGGWRLIDDADAALDLDYELEDKSDDDSDDESDDDDSDESSDDDAE